MRSIFCTCHCSRRPHVHPGRRQRAGNDYVPGIYNGFSCGPLGCVAGLCAIYTLLNIHRDVSPLPSPVRNDKSHEVTTTTDWRPLGDWLSYYCSLSKCVFRNAVLLKPIVAFPPSKKGTKYHNVWAPSASYNDFIRV